MVEVVQTRADLWPSIIMIDSMCVQVVYVSCSIHSLVILRAVVNIIRSYSQTSSCGCEFCLTCVCPDTMANSQTTLSDYDHELLMICILWASCFLMLKSSYPPPPDNKPPTIAGDFVLHVDTNQSVSVTYTVEEPDGDEITNITLQVRIKGNLVRSLCKVKKIKMGSNW